ANNNRYILQAILESIRFIAPAPHPELNTFVSLITAKIENNSDVFANPEIQKFLLVLKKFSLGKVNVNPKAILYSDYFDGITGTLSVQMLDFTGQALTHADLATFCVVRNIIGNLTFKGNNALTSMSGLDNLESIEGDLTITQTGIRHLNGLNSLERVKGKIDISQNPELCTVNGFTSLITVDTFINIAHNQVLKTINGFNSLQQIKKGALTIQQCPQLSDIGGFCNLTWVKNIEFKRLNITHVDFLYKLIKQQPEFKGSLKITACRLESLNGFGYLKRVGSSFYLHGNRLKNLKGLENLQHVGASFSLSNNQLTDISSLANLESVNGMLGLANNQLTALHGLENLKLLKTVNWSEEKRTFVINDNKQLQDIKALSNMLTQDNYVIIYTDDYKQYKIKPAIDSVFHSNIIELHDESVKKIIPTYLFIDKKKHDYTNFRSATHNRLLNYLLDFETDANNLVISFTGFKGNLGGVFYNRYPWIIDNIRTHKIFMNDTQNIWYLKGIPSITYSMEENIQFIQELVSRKKYKKIMCVGTSMGGYMSLLIGYLIQATDIIAFAPQIFLDKDNRIKYKDARWAGALKALPKSVNQKYLDLSLLYQEKTNLITKIQIHYGRQLTLDTKHIEHLGEYPNIELYPYDIEEHYIPKYLDEQGLLRKIIIDALTYSHED
ncbi:MAG: hypothetical protein HOP02_08760, partial [Methylococcaceae bacterium]|nr:hypothetical protein [Methylococcaceae bacterium]